MKGRIYLGCLLSLICSQSIAGEWPAQVNWSGERLLSLPVNAVVKKVHVRPGETLKKGQVLVSLDCGQYQAKYEHDLALVKGLEPVVERAKKDKELADELFDRTVLSEVEHREAELKYIETRSRFDAALAQSNENQWYKNQCELKTDQPVIVLNVKVKEGELFNIQTQFTGLLTVADSSAINLVASVSLPLARNFKPGENVKAEIDGKAFSGQLVSVQYESNKAARLVARINHFDIRLIGVKNAKLITQ